jgi:KaiC/GvpD/RAD55 family RecA-like ATPase
MNLTELKKLPVWLLHNATKQPFYATNGEPRRGENGDASDRAELVSFDVAKERLDKNPKSFTGIGLALLPELGVTVYDFDKATDAEGTLKDRAADIIKGLGATYVEWSPSGHGVHAFVSGKSSLPDNRDIGDGIGIDVFTDKKYVTFTGRAITDVADDAPFAPINEEVEVKLRKKGATVESDDDEEEQWNRNKPGSFEKLKAALEFLDPAKAEDRDSWMRITYAIGNAFGHDEVGEQLALDFARRAGNFNEKQTLDFYHARKKTGRKPVTVGTIFKWAYEAGFEWKGVPRVVKSQTLSEFLDRQPPRWLVRGVAQLGDIGVIYGQPGSSKTFLATDLAMLLAQKEGKLRWFERRIKPGGVIYVTSEGNLTYRLRAYMVGHNNTSADDYPNFRILQTNLNLCDQKGTDVAALVEDVKQKSEELHGVVLVVLDTLNAMMPGGDENSSIDMGMMVMAGKAIRDACGCTVVYVHHSGKDESKGSRGHSSLRAAADFELQVRTEEDGARTAEVSKVRDGETGQSFSYDLEYIGLGKSPDPDADPDETIGSCIVKPKPPDYVPVERKKIKPLSAFDDMALQTLGDEGKGVTLDAWRERYYAINLVPDGEERTKLLDARRKRFDRSVYALIEAGRVTLSPDGRYHAENF